MPSYTSQDASIFKNQVVKAYAPDGVTFLGLVPDAPYLVGVTDAINAATNALTVHLPRRIDSYDGENQPGSMGTLVLGNVWKWYVYGPALPASGKLRYQGIVDSIAPSIDGAGGETVDVVITPYSSILGDHGIVGPITMGTAGVPASYIDTMTMFNNWFNGVEIDSGTGAAYGAPFTLAPTNPAATGNTSQFAFQNQTLLAALNNILLLSPANWFFRFNVDKTATFNQFPTSATYTLKIGQHISQISFAMDNTPRKNVIVLQGAGSILAVARGSSISSIGPRTYMKQDSRLTDQNTANLLAAGLLAFYDRPQIRAKVTIPDYRGDTQPGLGFDIEQFQPGQTVTILDSRAPAVASQGPASTWGQFVWGRDKWATTTTGSTNISLWGSVKWGQFTWGESVGSIFNTVVPIVACTYNFHSVDLELGFRQPSMLRAIYALEAQFQDTTLIS